MAANADAIRVDFSSEAGDAILQRRQRIQDISDVLRAALPERRLFQSIANCLHEADVFFAGVAALDRGVVVSGLNGDVTVGCPVAREGLAAVLRAAGTVRKDYDGIFARIVWIKNSNVKILAAIQVVEDEVIDFGDSVRTSC